MTRYARTFWFDVLRWVGWFIAVAWAGYMGVKGCN